MGSCYSVQGKGENKPYFTVEPLSRESPILQGDADLTHSSPAKADPEPPPKSALKSSPNCSQGSSPLFEKKVQHQVSFDLMPELEIPLSGSTSHASGGSSPDQQKEALLVDAKTSGEGVTSDQSKANGVQGTQIFSEGEPLQGLLLKSSGVMNLSQDELAPGGGTANGEMSDTTPDLLRNTVARSESPSIPPSSQLQTIVVSMELTKEFGKTLGFSIAGGRGSTPAYEDVDESIFVTKIAPGGLAEADGRLRLGDKLIQVNDVDMVNATHAEAVAALKSVTDACKLVVSREVLVVMPEDLQKPGQHPDSPTDLPSPKAKLVYAEGEEEGVTDENGEMFAKKIVSEILDRSVDRYVTENGAAAGGVGEVEEAGTLDSMVEQEAPPHDNYVNFDIAQTVLGAGARKQPVERGESLPPMPTMVNGFDHDRPLERHSTSYSDLDDEEEDYPRERVMLDRSIGKLGLSIAGGADHISHVFGQGRPGIYISKITRGGAAEATGKLRLGDRILEVNNHNVRFANHQQAVQLLISQTGNIELLVQHVPQPPGLQMVVLEKEPNDKLGISIRGGGKGSKGNPLDRNDEGIFISKIAVGGAAAKDKQLKVGHRILEVNGISLLGASHLDAVKALRSSPDRVTITVCKGFDPKEVLRRKSEAEALASGRAEKIPLSAASSLALDDALNSLLSESMDSLNLPQKSQSAIAPAAYAVGSPRHISRSYMDISGTDSAEPVTAEELDEVLKGLTSFGDIDYSKLEANGKKDAEDQKTAAPVQQPISLSEILSPLQEGLFSKDSSDISVIEDETLEQKVVEQEREVSGKQTSESALEEELSSVDVGDTSSFLETLDSEVSMMQDEVSQTESEIAKEVKDDEETPKIRRKSTRTRLKVEHVPDKMPSPQTRRRAEAIKMLVEPPNPKASEAAVKSIIGEVFGNVSFEEFERASTTPRSGLSSGILTPTMDDFRSMSPDQKASGMNDLLSALHNISTSEEPVQEQAHQTPDIGGEVFESPPVKVGEEEVAEQPREKANMMPSSETEEKSDGVVLRVSSGPRPNPDKRKSAPPKVPEKPTTMVSPEKLSFQEKLALHKKVADSSGSGPVAPSVPKRPQSGSEGQRHRPHSTVGIPEVEELTLKHTHSEGEMEPEAAVEDTAPVSLSERIASLQAEQTKAGLKPVEVHPSLQSTTRKVSSEEKRLAHITTSNLDEDELSSTTDLHGNQDSSTTYVLESGPSDAYISASEDSSVDPKPLLPDGVSVADNSNSNNNDNDAFVTTASLYVATPAPATPAVQERAMHHGEESSEEKHESEKDTTEETRECQEEMGKINRVEVFIRNSASTDSVPKNTSKSNSESTVCQSQDPTF